MQYFYFFRSNLSVWFFDNKFIKDVGVFKSILQYQRWNTTEHWMIWFLLFKFIIHLDFLFSVFFPKHLISQKYIFLNEWINFRNIIAIIRFAINKKKKNRDLNQICKNLILLDWKQIHMFESIRSGISK